MNLAHIADNMAEQTGKRHKCLTKDSAKALAATCRGFVDIAKQLLTTTHEYVLFGLFTTDPLEKMFGKLRQGVGRTYFINVRQVLEKNLLFIKQLSCLNLIRFFSKWRQNWAISAIFAAST